MINCKVSAEDKKLYLFHSFDENSSSGICREPRLDTRFTATHPDIVIVYKTFRFNGVGGADQKQTVECALKLEKTESITSATTIADCTCKDACQCDSESDACKEETDAANDDSGDNSDTAADSDNDDSATEADSSDDSNTDSETSSESSSGANQSQNMLPNANAEMPATSQPTVEEATVTTLEPAVDETTTTTLNPNSALQSTEQPTIQPTVQPTVGVTVQPTVLQNDQPTHPPEFLARDDNINEGKICSLDLQNLASLFKSVI